MEPHSRNVCGATLARLPVDSFERNRVRSARHARKNFFEFSPWFGDLPETCGRHDTHEKGGGTNSTAATGWRRDHFEGTRVPAAAT